MSSGLRVRAVVDTNILVRGILRKHPESKAVQLYEAIHRRRFRLVASAYLLEEIRRVLESPELQAIGAPSPAMIAKILRGLRRTARNVRGNLEVDMVPTDARDNPIVACALEGDAAYLVTDDRKDLLPLKVVRIAGYRPVRVVTPALLLELLRRGDA